MPRLSLLALAALAAAVMGQGLATCDEAGLAPCSAAVSLCVANSGGDPTALCACRGKFDTCYKAAGCPQASVDAVVHACELSGCPVDVCKPAAAEAAGAPSTHAPTPLGQGLATCDEAGLAPCSAAVSLCVANSGGDPTALCACRGKFDTCYKAAGCPQASVDAVVRACELSGCPTNVCKPAAGSPPPPAPLSDSNCDDDDQARCRMVLGDCMAHSGGSAAVICSCRGKFDGCLARIGCPPAMVQAAVQLCESSGCPAPVCAGGGKPCGGAAVTECGIARTECLRGASGGAACACHGSYDACLSAGGCSSDAAQTCAAAGCAAPACAGM